MSKRAKAKTVTMPVGQHEALMFEMCALLAKKKRADQEIAMLRGHIYQLELLLIEATDKIRGDVL